MKNNCGCCEGLDKLTPLSTANRPGLDALIYRVGSHATFMESMLACLSNKDYPELAALTSRSKDDTSIALLDAWATIADVLTFYQERIANEAYLRTSLERRSILELARLVGYKLRPGVSASVYLGFTMDKDAVADIPIGARAQSIPGPGELPQAFETSETIPAREEWNALQPRLTRPHYITSANVGDIDTVYLEGIATNLKPNDPLVFVFGDSVGQQELGWVETVEAQAEEERTKVILQRAIGVGLADSGEVIEKLLTASESTELKRIIEKYGNLDAYDVSSGVTSDKVLSWLKKLEAQLTEGVTIALASNSLSVALQNLRPLLQYAERRHYNNLERWIQELIDSFQEYSERMSSEKIVVAEAQQQKSPKLSATASANFSLSNMVDSLLIPPSQQPANALKLDRRVENIYTAKGDMGPRLLTSIKTQLKETLYKALNNAEVARPFELLSSETMRVKAPPFGHNVLLKPIYDEQGRIIDHEEWPLSGSETAEFSVELVSNTYLIADLFSSATNLDSIQVIARYSRGTESWTTTLQLLAQDPVNVGEFTFMINLSYATAENVSEADFQFVDTSGKTRKKLALLWDNTDGMGVQVNQDDSRPIAEAQTLHYVVGYRNVLAHYSEDGFTIGVSDKSPLPLSEIMRKQIFLDNEYNGIVAGTWIVIERPDLITGNIRTEILTIENVATISLAAYGMTGKSTQLTLSEPWLGETGVDLSFMRATTAYVQSETLSMAEEPILEPVLGASIVLNGFYDGLDSGRWVAVTGERVDISGSSSVKGTELAMIASVSHDVGKVTQANDDAFDLLGDKLHTTIQFANSLAYEYKRDDVTIYGNVVKATHGETRTEVLGSGDGSKAFQQFTLSFSPLTYIAANTTSGVESTLEVRVNDVLWQEALSIFGLGANDRQYITRTDNDAKTMTHFGDGIRGLRLPTGTENVSAVYRSGIGKSGNVAGEQISLLATRPLGVKGVINPLPATGGADRETRDQARRNTPFAVMALDRLVSVQDYADFARTFAGIGKASATRLTDGNRQLVYVTIAGAEDIPISKSSDLYRSLFAALHKFGDPHQPIQLAIRELILLIIHARVRVSPEYQWETLEPKIRTALLDHFSFERRDLGQDALLSEAISVIQGITGVVYVDVDVFDGLVEIEPIEDLIDSIEGLGIQLGEENQPKPRVPANMAYSQKPIIDNHDQQFGVASKQTKKAALQLSSTSKSVLKPAQIAILKPDIKDTLILTELT